MSAQNALTSGQKPHQFQMYLRFFAFKTTVLINSFKSSASISKHSVEHYFSTNCLKTKCNSGSCGGNGVSEAIKKQLRFEITALDGSVLATGTNGKSHHEPTHTHLAFVTAAYNDLGCTAKKRASHFSTPSLPITANTQCCT